MKVRMNITLTGTRDGSEWPARGETVDLPADEAASMLAAGHVVPLKDTAETAEQPAIESAAMPTPKRRK